MKYRLCKGKKNLLLVMRLLYIKLMYVTADVSIYILSVTLPSNKFEFSIIISLLSYSPSNIGRIWSLLDLFLGLL